MEMNGTPPIELAHSGGSKATAANPQMAQWLQKVGGELASVYADGLPVLPETLFRLNELLTASTVDLNAVSRTVGTDPIIAAQLLRLASEELAVGEMAATSVSDLIVSLGISPIRSIVLTTHLLPPEQDLVTRLQTLRRHSCCAAALAELISVECGYRDTATAYTAALLHDIGRVPLELGGHSEPDSGCDRYPSHCLLGAHLAALWKFPPQIADAIKHHHSPAAAACDPFLVAVVALSDQLSSLASVPSVAATSGAWIDVLNQAVPLVRSSRTASLAERCQAEAFSCLQSQPGIDNQQVKCL
jgi:putative nucleotidyltransferase with HDIG domain